MVRHFIAVSYSRPVLPDLRAGLQPESTAVVRAELVFDGIKMGARVALNGEPLGEMRSQFLRCALPVDIITRTSHHESFTVGGTVYGVAAGTPFPSARC